MAGDKITVPVWLLPKRGELDKLIQRGIKIPATVTKQFESYAAAGKGSAIGGGASIARGFAEGAGGKTLSLFERQTLKEEKEKKKRSLKAIGILAGISFALTKVPSILGGVLKMLSFGFLLILKPLADLLAMVLLPIANLVLKLATSLGKLAGTGMGGMIVAAVIGLIVAIISGIAVASITSSLITGAVAKLVTGAIAATIFTTLSVALAAGVVLGLVAKVLGATDFQAVTIGALGAITALVLLALGAVTIPEIAVILGVSVITAFILKLLDSIIFQVTGINIGAWIQEHIWDAITRGNIEKSRPTEAGMQWYTPEETQTKFPKQSAPSSTVNININGSISSIKEIGDIVKNNVTQALNTTNVRNR